MYITNLFSKKDYLQDILKLLEKDNCPIKSISYTFSNEPIDHDWILYTHIQGDDWDYIPNHETFGLTSSGVMPPEVEKIFPKPCLFWSEKRWLELFDAVFNHLEAEGENISRGFIPGRKHDGKNIYARWHK